MATKKEQKKAIQLEHEFTDEEKAALIDLVRDSEPLWQTHHPKHADCSHTRLLWAKTGELFNLTGVVQAHWESLRNGHNTVLCKRRSVITGSALGDVPRKWKFEDAMEFRTSSVIHSEGSRSSNRSPMPVHNVDDGEFESPEFPIIVDYQQSGDDEVSVNIASSSTPSFRRPAKRANRIPT